MLVYVCIAIPKRVLYAIKGQSESVYRRRTDNTMTKKKQYKQRSTKHTHKTKDSETRTPSKTRGELPFLALRIPDRCTFWTHSHRLCKQSCVEFVVNNILDKELFWQYNDLQNIHIKLKIQKHEPHQKPEVNFKCSGKVDRSSSINYTLYKAVTNIISECSKVLLVKLAL
jgi:hypothetical protein